MISGRRNIVVTKGMKLQQEEEMADSQKQNELNSQIGFKCLHYSVTESAGVVKIIILKKSDGAMSLKVRTVDGSAQAGEDYFPIDREITFTKNQREATVDVEIKDDDDWEPDEDFFVELYDPVTN
jgi:solute carrier family 8 (sodium/calcium exchanger)